jgi:hypothetical protein
MFVDVLVREEVLLRKGILFLDSGDDQPWWVGAVMNEDGDTTRLDESKSCWYCWWGGRESISYITLSSPEGEEDGIKEV